MELLQYSFALGPMHSMDAVRSRVAAKRHLLDAWPGLCWKAWLLSEPLPGRCQEKTYAPLYLFEHTTSAHAFLCSDIYKAVTDTFGWTLPHFGRAINARQAPIPVARSCALTVRSLQDHASLVEATVATPCRESAGAASAHCPGAAHHTIHQIDISRMQLRSFTFWGCDARDLVSIEADVIYDVVALSPLSRGLT